jgi:hypothetical protein
MCGSQIIIPPSVKCSSCRVLWKMAHRYHTKNHLRFAFLNMSLTMWHKNQFHAENHMISFLFDQGFDHENTPPKWTSLLPIPIHIQIIALCVLALYTYTTLKSLYFIASLISFTCYSVQHIRVLTCMTVGLYVSTMRWTDLNYNRSQLYTGGYSISVHSVHDMRFVEHQVGLDVRRAQHHQHVLCLVWVTSYY